MADGVRHALVPGDASLAEWRVDIDALGRLAQDRAGEYRAARPFPHAVFDNLFPPELLRQIGAEFPPPSSPGWERIDHEGQRKLQWRNPAVVPARAEAFFRLVESAPFLDFLEQLTGIPGLLVDPRREYGGLHQIERGGFLKIHDDITLQTQVWLYRRLNMITYLNEDWDQGWGGALELWDDTVSRKLETIPPLFNRTVIFNSDPPAKHGHPDPLGCPADVTRRSLSIYYFTSPANPLSKVVRGIGSYRARPGESLPVHRWKLLRVFVSEMMPPPTVRAVRNLSRRLRGGAPDEGQS